MDASSNQQTLAPTIYRSPEQDKELAKSSHLRPQSDPPVYANFASSKLTIGAGVAIFHIASARVVICWHSGHRYWFLPKGRRDAGEDSVTGAEREGFEESGYRNRLLPIPMKHRQPQAHEAPDQSMTPFATEPIWTQLIPTSVSSQYILFWYIAETLPPDVESQLNAQLDMSPRDEKRSPYQCPPKYPIDMTLSDRVKLEPEGYEPVHHMNTGVDAEEAMYRSFLLPVEKAIEKLQGQIQADVIRSGWEAIRKRLEMDR